MQLAIALMLASFFIGIGAVIGGVILERQRRHIAEFELGFWDTNVIAALHLAVIQ